MKAFFKSGAKLWPYLLIGLICAGAVVGGNLLFNSAPTTASANFYTVQRGEIKAVVRTTGRLELARQTKLFFRTTEMVRRFYVKPGDFVPVGTLLAEQDSSQLERDYQQAVAQREIARFNSGAQAERGQNPGTVSELYSAARQAEVAESQLVRAKAALDNARIYAPFDGTILSLEVSEGDNVGYGQPVLTFGDLSRLQVRAEVDEIDVANVAVGQSVQFSLDALPGKSFEGMVSLLSPAPSQRQGSTVYVATVAFAPAPDLPLRPGMAANLTITSLTRRDVLLVPNRALETIGLRKYVTVQRANGTLEKTPVETGLSNPDQTEIISGLTDGTKIVLPR